MTYDNKYITTIPDEFNSLDTINTQVKYIDLAAGSSAIIDASDYDKLQFYTAVGTSLDVYKMQEEETTTVNTDVRLDIKSLDGANAVSEYVASGSRIKQMYLSYPSNASTVDTLSPTTATCLARVKFNPETTDYIDGLGTTVYKETYGVGLSLLGSIFSFDDVYKTSSFAGEGRYRTAGSLAINDNFTISLFFKLNEYRFKQIAEWVQYAKDYDFYKIFVATDNFDSAITKSTGMAIGIGAINNRLHLIAVRGGSKGVRVIKDVHSLLTTKNSASHHILVSYNDPTSTLSIKLDGSSYTYETLGVTDTTMTHSFLRLNFGRYVYRPYESSFITDAETLCILCGQIRIFSVSSLSAADELKVRTEESNIALEVSIYGYSEDNDSYELLAKKLDTDVTVTNTLEIPVYSQVRYNKYKITWDNILVDWLNVDKVDTYEDGLLISNITKDTTNKFILASEVKGKLLIHVKESIKGIDPSVNSASAVYLGRNLKEDKVAVGVVEGFTSVTVDTTQTRYGVFVNVKYPNSPSFQEIEHIEVLEYTDKVTIVNTGYKAVEYVISTIR